VGIRLHLYLVLLAIICTRILCAFFTMVNGTVNAITGPILLNLYLYNIYTPYKHSILFFTLIMPIHWLMLGIFLLCNREHCFSIERCWSWCGSLFENLHARSYLCLFNFLLFLLGKTHWEKLKSHIEKR